MKLDRQLEISKLPLVHEHLLPEKTCSMFVAHQRARALGGNAFDKGGGVQGLLPDAD